MFESMLNQLEADLHATLSTSVAGMISAVRAGLEGAHAGIVKETIRGLAEVAEERANALAEVDARRTEIGREIAAMHKHKEAHEGRVELNIGGHRFVTSVQTLRRVPHTFFDAYFSGRYAQDVCNDGSIFVDRDGEHFGHVLEYMRDGVVSVAEAGARPSVSLLRALKREFGFYCIELCADDSLKLEQPEVAFVMGGFNTRVTLSSMERYDVSTGQWSAVAAMGTARCRFGACVVSGEIFVTGGEDDDENHVSSVERYSPSSDTWSTVAPLPQSRSWHAAVGVNSAMYVLGGRFGDGGPTTNVYKFDSTLGTWSEVSPLPSALYGSAACAILSDIYVFGGEDDSDADSVYKYDTEVDEWTTLAPMPNLAYGHSVCAIGGLVYLTGLNSFTKEVWRFEAALGLWSTLAPTLHNHHNASTFVVGGCLYVAGGNYSTSTVERYDIATDTWTEVTDMLTGRLYCSAVKIASVGPTGEQDLFDALIDKATRQCL
jgi:hypothetical protein